MSRLKEPLPAKVVMSIFAREETIIQEARGLAQEFLGDIEFDSGLMPFEFTDYYEPEFGRGLKRCFVAFSGLRPQDSLRAIKLGTWRLEYEHTVGGKRRFNLDPGILTLERLVLATGKNYVHRIYLGSGVFADLTLIFKKGGFAGLDWTYRDYLLPQSIAFWHMVRDSYRKELKEGGYL